MDYLTITNKIEANIENSIEYAPKCFNNKTINILDEDSIINILSLLEFNDLVQCRRLNKRFLQVINDNLLVYKSFFKKYCFSPKYFLAVPQNVLLDIKHKFNNKNMLLSQDHLDIHQDSNNYRKKLFFDLEKSLFFTQKISHEVIKTISHNNKISSACFSKDNSLFITMSEIDGVVKIFDCTSGNYKLLNEVAHVAIGKDYHHYSVLLSPDKSYMITSSSFLHIIWHADTVGDYKQIISLNNLFESDIFFRDDSKRLFIKSRCYPLKIFDLKDGKCECVLTLTNAQINNAFDIYTGKLKDNILLSDDLKNDSWLYFLIQRLAMYFINTITYSNDMKLIYVNNIQNSTILEYVNQKWQMKIKMPSLYSFSFFSSDNQRMITGYSCSKKKLNTATVWNISGSEAYKEITLVNVISVNFSADSRYIVAYDLNNFVNILHLTNGTWQIKSTISMLSRGEVFFGNYNWIVVSMQDNNLTIFQAYAYYNEK